MPRALVFPGGAEDEADGALFDGMRARGMLSRRQCALRELAEETGVFLAASKDVHEWDIAEGSDPALAGKLRLGEDALRVPREDPSGIARAASLALPCLDRFRTPAFETASFDAWFMAAELSARCSAEACSAQAAAAGVPVVTVAQLASGEELPLDHSQEAAGVVWATAAEALALHEAGRASLPPPQWIVLSQLCGRGPDRRAWPVSAPATAERESLASLARRETSLLRALVAAEAEAVREEEECDWRPPCRMQLVAAAGGGAALVMPGDEAYAGLAFAAAPEGRSDAWARGDGAAAVDWPGAAVAGRKHRVHVAARDERDAEEVNAVLCDRLATQHGRDGKPGSLPFGKLVYTAQSCTN